jgi:hypothetical protein
MHVNVEEVVNHDRLLLILVLAATPHRRSRSAQQQQLHIVHMYEEGMSCASVLGPYA